MAEYIDREKLNKKKKYLLQTQGKPFPKSEYFIKVDDFWGMPTADVIERSKINEVIAKAIKYRDDEKNDFCEVEVGAINGVLEFFKHIGE
jgi:hypothetical protein